MPVAPRRTRWLCCFCRRYQPIIHRCRQCGRLFETHCGRRAVCFQLNNALASFLRLGICYECKLLNDSQNKENDQDRPNSGPGGSGSNQGPPPAGAAGAASTSTGPSTSYYESPSIRPEGGRPIRATGRSDGGDSSEEFDEKITQITDEQLLAGNGYGIRGDLEGGWYRKLTDDEDDEGENDIEMNESEPQDDEADSNKKGDSGQKSSGRSQDQPGPSREHNSDDDMTPEDKEVAALMQSQHETELALEQARAEARTVKMKMGSYYEKSGKNLKKKKGRKSPRRSRKRNRIDESGRCRDISPMERDLDTDDDSDEGIDCKSGFRVPTRR